MQHLCHSEDTQWITPWHGLHPCYTTFISHTLPLFYLFPTLIYLIYHICRRAEAIDDEDEDEDVDVDDESLQSHSSFYLSAFIYTIYIIIALSPLLMLLLLYTKHSHDEIISYPYMWISTSIHAGMWMMGAIIVWMGQLLTPTSSPSVSLLLWILRIFTLLSSISWLPHIVSFIIAISTSHDISHDSINHIPLWLYIETMVIYGLILMITLMMWKVLPRVIQDDNDVDASIQSGYVRIPTTRTIHVTPMTSPEDNASILSRLTFSYLASFITYVSRRRSPLKVTHLPPASYVDDIYVITHDLASQWKQGRRDAKHISLLRVLWWTYRSRLIINWLWLIPSIVLRLSGPFLLQRIISFHDDLSVPTYVGYLFVLALFLCPTIDSICSLRFGYNLDRMGLHVRTALTMMIYEKACKLPVAVQMEQEEDDDDDDNKKVKKKQSSDQSNPGAMINLISVDADRIKNTFYQLHTVVEVPVILIAGIVYLYLLLGWSMFVGIGLLLLLTPINWLFASCGSRIYRTFMTVRDIRMNLFHELLLAIKMLKVAGWEEMMQEKVMNARNSEMIQVRRRGLLTGLTRFYYQMIPTWVTASVLSVYAITRADQMNAATVFTAISLFGIMQSYISALPSLIPAYVEATIASSRLESFLLLNEVDVRCDDDDVKREGKSIVVQDASWTWYKIVRDDGITIHDSPTSTESLSTSLLTIPSPPIALSHINLHIPQGALVVVIGAVGSGKSCLLQALAGELHLLEGRISISHNIAYTPQQPYLRNATLRDNICFAHEYEPERYTHVIEICGLQPDIERMPGKDMCEIGEKGINLSGGQKQRVSLARALYANASIYLLDDPLSALDADVSYHVFQHAILHHLHHTTRILVTHAVQLVAKHADYIIIMKHGMIYAQGTYEEMIKQYPYEMHHTMKTTTEEKQSSSQQSEDEKKSDPDVIDAPVKQDTPSSIISTEDQSFGLVHLSTYIQYSTSMGIPLLIVALILQICQQGCDFMINWWLTQWTDDTQHIHPTTYYIIIYTSLTALSAILILAYQTSVVYCGYRTSHHFHTCALDAVIAAPLQWFDSTPVGRLLSRFSRDLDVIDDDLQFTIALLWTTICQCIAVLIAITYVTPFFLITAIPLTCIYLSIQSSYRPASRELNRLVNVARSPVYALITETTSGLDTIRCYTNQYHITHHTTSHLMIDRLRELITQHMKTLMLQIALKRWLQWRLQIIGTLVSVIAALLCVWSRSSFPLSSSLVGLSLSYASSLTSAMTWLINQVVWTETEMNSVERFISLTHVTPEDLEQHVKNDVDQHWPQYGTIRFENVTMSYHPHVPNPRLILNNLTFTIPSSTRIGVVGRTGSGKSSLISCLFRIVPPLIDGRIIIDDVDIATVPLRVLRSRMSLISQDPLLLNGTIRTNLDPTNRYINDDQRLWHVLEKVEMRSFVESHDKGLDMPITQSGANLSVGQRQLVCLARALLHPRRILVMDECTASIDTHTATSIQHTLHQMYASCTVITIAHRLSTIMSHDVIMVMDHGHIVEMDTPATLVANPNSYFSRLVEHSHQ